ncbi:MAG: sterol desaturase family protein [Bdellovibrionales bacterium]|nr:sterol desaturase family protein [Bdellovibrionales bacterium]
MFWLLVAVQGLALYAMGTVFFDVVHYALHRFAHCRSIVLRFGAALHQAHHDFLDTSLDFHEEHVRRNLLYHLIPEYLTHTLATLVGLFFFEPLAVAVAVLAHTLNFTGAVFMRGRDLNHVHFEKLPQPGPGSLVGPKYHSLHHVYPEQYMGSMLRLFDWVVGTGCPLPGRRVAITGASGSFGSGMVECLRKAGVQSIRAFTFGKDWTYDDYSQIEAVLPDTDILVLAHGSKVDRAMEANCTSFVELIERFRKVALRRRFPVEIWAVGSEIESHSHWGNAELKVYKASKGAYARFARRYYRDSDFLYRHICPAAFTSRMGPGLISGRFAARWALFLIRRGFHYIPVTYTGIAFLNYLKFAFGVHAKSAAPVGLAGPSNPSLSKPDSENGNSCSTPM